MRDVALAADERSLRPSTTIERPTRRLPCSVVKLTPILLAANRVQIMLVLVPTELGATRRPKGGEFIVGPRSDGFVTALPPRPCSLNKAKGRTYS